MHHEHTVHECDKTFDNAVQCNTSNQLNDIKLTALNRVDCRMAPQLTAFNTWDHIGDEKTIILTTTPYRVLYNVSHAAPFNSGQK